MSAGLKNDEQELIVVDPPHPPEIPIYSRILQYGMLSTIGLIALPYIGYLAITKWKIFSDICAKSAKISIKKRPEYKDSTLLHRIWRSEAGKQYANILEYQRREGYCSRTTQRCVLKSIPQISADRIPEEKRGPTTVQNFASFIDECSKGATKSTVVLGTEGFDAFMSAIQRANDPKVRLSANFLRTPLFGFNQPIFFPHNVLLGFFGGHFSPIVGYLEDANLVCVFDVNHNYGAFLVTPQRLYDAIATFDVTSGKSRGLVVTEILS
jgi:Phytochelatin synthase